MKVLGLSGGFINIELNQSINKSLRLNNNYPCQGVCTVYKGWNVRVSEVMLECPLVLCKKTVCDVSTMTSRVWRQSKDRRWIHKLIVRWLINTDIFPISYLCQWGNALLDMKPDVCWHPSWGIQYDYRKTDRLGWVTMHNDPLYS